MARDSLLTLLLPELPAGTPQARRLPRLERLLARADRLPAPPDGLSGLLCRRFGLSRPEQGDWPVAALTALADRVPGDAACWLRADPVHLLADQAHLVLLLPGTLSPEEADALIGDIGETFSGEPWRLCRGDSPQRWYLRLPQDPAIRTTPLERVLGRAIDGHLPEGELAGEWRRLATELQMVLHRHPVNLEREAAGLPPVNALWFWGGGGRPEPRHSPVRWLSGEDPLLRGLAAWSGAGVTPLAEIPPGEGAILQPVVDRDPATSMALERLLQAHHGPVELLTSHAAFRFERWHNLRFWRRPRGLEDYR